MRKLIIFLLFIFSLQGLAASDLQVFIDSRESYVGQPLQLTMQISNNKALERPVLGDIPGFQITASGESRYEQRSLGSGGNSRSVTMEYSWRLLPLKTGTLTIPAFEMELEDGVVRSSEIEVLIREPGPIEGYHLFLTAQGDTVFPGIPVRLSLKWLFSSEVSRPEFSLPFLNQDTLKIEDLPPPSTQSSDIYQFKVEGRTMYAVQSAEIYEGEQYASLTILWDIYPQEVGSLDLESVFISFQRTVVNRQGRKSYAPAVIPSNSLSLDVKDLPREMKNFPGGIFVSDDKLEIDVSLDQTRIYPGDPLELTLTLKGLSSPELSDFKGFSSIEELKGIVKVDRGSLMSEVEGKSKVYTQKIRIETDQLQAFPSLTMPYYNLQKGIVENAVTKAVPLTMISLEEAGSTESGGFINWNSREKKEETVSLKANHSLGLQLHKTVLNSLNNLMLLLLFLVTILLLLLPFFVKTISSIRFGRKKADIRVLLRKAFKEYEKQPDLKQGQKLHEMLLLWDEASDKKSDAQFQNLILLLEESLWKERDGNPDNKLDSVITGIKGDLFKQLNKRGGE